MGDLRQCRYAPIQGNTGARNLRICWPDAKVTDGPAEHHRQLELPPGPAYIDAPKSEQLERAMKAAVENKVSRDALVARVQAAKTAVNSAAVGGLMRMTEGGNLGWGAAGDHVVLPAPGRWDVPALPSDSAAYSKSSKGGSSWGGSRGGGAGAGVFPNGNEDKPSGAFSLAKLWVKAPVWAIEEIAIRVFKRP